MEFKTVEEVYSALFGNLLRDEGKIVSSKFNKLLGELGLDKVSAKFLQEVYNEITEDEYLDSIKDQAIDGKIKLEDINAIDGSKPFEKVSKVEAISTYVTDDKRRLSSLREIRRQQEPHAYFNMLVQDLERDIKQELKHPVIEHVEKNKAGREHLVILLSDWHLGYVIKDSKTGGYNYTILKNRLSEFLAVTKEEIYKREDTLKSITIYFVGDLVEHVNMRNVNQAFDTEFTLSEQISKGTRLLIDTIKSIASSFDGQVRFGMVGGNHDRLQGNKNEKIYNDNVAYIVLSTLLMLKENGLLNGIDIINNLEDVYTIEDNVGYTNIIVNHGDNLKGNVNHIPKFIKDHVFDILITGHVHHFKTKQEDYHRQHITVGSTIGYNNYSKELNLSRTSPSQQLLFLDEGSHDVTIKTVYLD